MKLRIKGNSIRLRVTQKELEQIKSEGIYEEKTVFPNGAVFTYSLVVDETKEPTAEFDGKQLKVKIPSDKAKEWLNNEKEVGIYSDRDVALKIVVEKDFRCLVPRGEDDSDAFPHPKEGIESC
ncbi:MAG: hypothetical protein N2Z23_07955 [Pyrinomonadaceae bacterium]|nr:hypothetical protein [Pyrinomonadaceae bacterium]MCX7640358.1 hypothetical protein [Pyrinomonadaceae bacterium]MDW8304786.1 hypothetical protein [Acidobacteriota bacterium]